MDFNRGMERRTEFLERCFETFCEHGLENTSLQKLADACGVTNGALIYYFGSKDNLIVEATAHCMAKVENDFMREAPENFEAIEGFLQEMPYLTAKLHGTKYRFMYQVYASPRYLEQGKDFFRGVNVRYGEYAKQLSQKLNMPKEFVHGMINIFVRACVHYALYEDEEYLKLQLDVIRVSLKLFIKEKKQMIGNHEGEM